MWLLEREYDIKVEQRAVRDEHLRDQHNRTACRSPSREADVLWFKQEQRHKRQLEFARRRPTTTTTVADEGGEASRFRVPVVRRSPGTRLGPPPARGTLTSTRRLLITQGDMGIPKDDVKSTSKSTCTGQVRSCVKGSDFAAKQAHLNLISTVRMQVHQTRTISSKKERVILGGIDNQKTQQTAGIQTEPGVVTVKEDDVLLLTDYLQEALNREAALRMKLTALQRSTATLLHSSEYLWKSRCSEDQLRSQIKALESQLQLCMKGLPQDDVKGLLVDMERRRGEREKGALLTTQKAAEQRAEAAAKIQNLQEAPQAASAESSGWQSQCKEVCASCTELRRGQDACTEQLQQLRSQLELCQGRECDLGQQLQGAQQTNKELRYRLSQLEGHKRALSTQLQEARDTLTSEEDHVADRLCATEKRLQMKEKECMELQAQLEALELESRSYQSSVMQCREELRQLRNQSSRKTSCGSWLVFVLLLFVFGAALVVGLCLYYPIIADYLQNVYLCLQQHMEDYLLSLASPHSSACFRPI
ncbi:hypothetical protein ACEWY4_000580 [Coilia grayii]|uniref:TRAF3 interacting protein 3 n=1 Tax=Coilia grayii TaxID=363190 RepID=A0ABD1KX31_9TELE